jgi:hypothetical protein
MRRTAGLAVAVALAGAAACGSNAATPLVKTRPTPSLLSVIALRGQVQVTDLRSIRYTPDLKQCVTRGAYADIAQGAQVQVINQRGLRVAVGQLSPGTLVDGARGPAGCSFGFNMSNAPGGSRLYTVIVADRPAVKVPAADILRIRVRFPAGS